MPGTDRVLEKNRGLASRGRVSPEEILRRGWGWRRSPFSVETPSVLEVPVLWDDQQGQVEEPA